MLCESCQKFDATVHQVKVEYLDGGQPGVREEHLCPQCAQAKGLHVGTPTSQNYPEIVQKLSKNLLEPFKQSASDKTSSDTIYEPCPQCGWTERDFRQTSRFGCPHDYEHFSEFVEEVLERIHGYTEHASSDHESRIEQLRGELDEAVLSEDYESAARLRDAIRELGATLENSEDLA
ncbi:MAG: UvrB/UvrC motif-containing protein [Planctomycetes bacterium]|nr:UvrB/UvrC motif-containing protein [Planctomycetota bacterium]